MLKKTLFTIFLISQILIKNDWAQSGEFFDDFNYTNNNDPQLSEFGWRLVHGSNGPPGGAIYDRNNITFHPDSTDTLNSLMYITAKTNNSFNDMRLARIETSEMIFWEGTYAARVYLDDTPKEWQDGNIQAFYTINTLKSDNDPDYSECDFEYLAWDVWGGGNTNSKLYTVTWETYANNPWNSNRAYSVLENNLEGWHTLLFTAVDDNTVRYYLDNNLIAEHTNSTQGDNIYPDAPMNISFINWISTDQQGSGLGENPNNRSSTMKIDWVYHSQNNQLSTTEVEEKVTDFKQNEVTRKNSMEPVSNIAFNDIPYSFSLEQNYPNPFNPNTVISYSIPKHSFVRMSVSNVLGQEVAILVNKEQFAGNYNIKFEAFSLPSGIYFYTLQSGKFLETKKLILLK